MHDARAEIADTPDFPDLAGAVEAPAEKRGTPWEETLRSARTARAGLRVQPERDHLAPTK